MLDEYRRAPRRELCACGLVISAGPSERAIILAVQAHQKEQQHRDWFIASGWGE